MADFYINQNPADKVLGNMLPEQLFMEWNEDTYDVLGSVFLREMNTEVRQSGELEVNENECRFDNLSYKMSGSTDFWWFIMEYNNYVDWQVPANAVLKVPNIDDIFILKNSMAVRQNLARYNEG